MYWWNRFVEFDRKPIDSHLLCGFVLEYSDCLTLISPLDDERFELNGYTVIQNSDVRRWRPVAEDSFGIRALRLKGIKPVRKRGISLASWPDLLKSAAERFPLLTIHRERADRGACYIGRLASMNRLSFQLNVIDADAIWYGCRPYRFRDLTCVAFGGGYEDALARVAAAYPMSEALPKPRRTRLKTPPGRSAKRPS